MPVCLIYRSLSRALTAVSACGMHTTLCSHAQTARMHAHTTPYTTRAHAAGRRKGRGRAGRAPKV